MKINGNTRLEGTSVVLVPYREIHVQKYHEWMSSSELQELTASEPLSLEQEYDMQKSWYNDEDKCTFIILDKQLYETTHDEIAAMIGDTNLFFNCQDDKTTAEAEIMIAEKSFRKMGRGKEAMLIMFYYAVQNLSVKRFTVKIGYENKPSINMFKNMKFSIESESDVFQEVTLYVDVSNDWITWLKEMIKSYKSVIHP